MPVSHSRSGTCPALANNIDIRVLLADRSQPFAARDLLDIRIRVHAQTVQIGIFDPPDSPLLEVFEQILVLQIHVRHRFVEPSAVGELLVVLRSVDVVVGSEAVIGVGELRELVDPVLIRQIFHPPVCAAAMVRHHVHQNLQPFLVCLCNHVCIECIGAVARINMVVIGASVAVVRPCFLVIAEHRRRPDCGTTEFGDMVKTIDDTLNIASPASVDICFVGFFAGVFGRVIALVAIYETVAHDQIDHIGCIETLTVPAALTTRSDRVVVRCFLVSFLEGNTVCAGLEHPEIHKQVVRALGVVLAARHEPVTSSAHQLAVHHLLHAHFGVLQILTVKHNGQRHLHVGPPAERLYLLNLRRSRQPSCQQHTY